MRRFGFGFAVGFVDRVEHLHEPPRVPQFEILGDHSDEIGRTRVGEGGRVW